MAVSAPPMTHGLVLGWLSAGLVGVALVPLTDEWEVYNNTFVNGGTALWVDVALVFAGVWLLAVPLAFKAWQARRLVPRLGWLGATVVVAWVCWMLSVTSAMGETTYVF